MGLLTFFADRERKAELRESKDEMLVGEVVRAMARKGWPTIEFSSTSDFQRVKFKSRNDDVLSAVYITLDRQTGTGAIGQALLGSQATLFVTCEVKNYLADPDDLLHMYRTDLANLFRISWKEIRINHEYNAIFGTTKHIINIDSYIGKGDPGVQALVRFLDERIQAIREKLRPYKK